MNTIQNDLNLPDNFYDYSLENQNLIKEYILQLTPIQKQAYSIAKQHLGTSFHILKSNAYLQWIKHKLN